MRKLYKLQNKTLIMKAEYWIKNGLIFLAAAWGLGLLTAIGTETAKTNYEILLTIGQISLTMFGFGLIGGVFENRPTKSGKKLFKISLYFLISAILFFFNYAMCFIISKNNIITIIITWVMAITILIAISSFIVGIWQLVTYLFEHLRKIKN